MLGTPTESSWPNVTDLDDWNVGFPKWPRIGLAREYADLGEIGINMLEVKIARKITRSGSVQQPPLAPSGSMCFL